MAHQRARLQAAAGFVGRFFLLFSVFMPGLGAAVADVVGEMNYIQIEPIEFALQDASTERWNYTSDVTRLWYSHFQADEDYASKPLFVFINGGPGCGTCMNLFSMNTAPYTLDRNRMSTNDLYKTNSFSWTALGNLLYIDAPNTGYSYMLDDMSYGWLNLWQFLNGENCHAYIDAAQVLRTILRFLDEHPTLQTNEVIMVGESYSGVRVSTMMNLLLYYQTYQNNERVYHDSGLVAAITNHFKAVFGREPPFCPEDVATQFGRQILIQPQIVDAYQGKDMYAAFEEPDSAISRLGYSAHATNSWEHYLSRYGGACDLDAVRGYLSEIDRDPYHVLQEASWTDDNEYFSMERLNDFNALEAITGNCSPSNVPYLLPAARTNALKFGVAQYILDDPIVKWLVYNIRFFREKIPMLESMMPGWKTGRIDMEYNPDALKYRLGELTELDAYVTGTNPYIFFGFMVNSGGYNLPMVVYSALADPYDISPGSSDRYGRMFLENLAVIDTFMTDAEYDYVVYSPALVSQFQENRFSNWVANVTSAPGDASRRYGSFTVDYKTNAISGLQEPPDYRTVSWRYYGESGHAVSASQPEEFRADVASWLQSRWYNVYPREGSVTGGTEVTIYGLDLCVDSNDLQAVTVRGATAEVLSVSSGRITFRTPALSQGAGDVVVDSLLYGLVTASNAFCAKLPQVITVQTPLESACFGVDEAIVCAATSSVSGLTVSFSIETTDPCNWPTNDADSFSMPAPGTATIRFEQAGNDDYFAAAPVIRHVAVTGDAARVYYVSEQGDDAHHGLSWDQAKRTPQGAAARAVSGDTILVSNGVYNIAGEWHEGSNRVVLAEGVTMRSVNGPEVTIIDGAGQMRSIYMKVDAHLEGFTLRNGYLGGAPSAWKERAGAGLFASQRSTIIDCVIQSNAIALSSSDYGYGGGCCMEHNVRMSHCRVLDNSVETSGANSLGGGIAIAASMTNCLIDNTVIAGNHTLHEGGGVYFDSSANSHHLLNCTVVSNQAPDDGSGIFAYGSGHTFNNCIVYGNTGAFDLYMNSPATVWYTNSCVPSTSGSYGIFVNSITDAPALLSDPPGMIYEASPCRDRGANSLTNSSTDAGGRPRVINDIVDIGAYEFQRWTLSGTNGWLISPNEPATTDIGTDFGSVSYGMPVTNELILSNVSGDALSVNLVLRGDDFDAFSLGVPAQLSLPADATTNIPFVFLANRQGTSVVELCFTDFDLTSFVNLQGEALMKSALSTPENLAFECYYNYLAPDPQLYALSNSGPSACQWRVEPSADWMRFLPESADLAATNAYTNLVAYVVPDDLAAGIYVSTNRWISTSADTVTQLVTLTVSQGVVAILFDNDRQAYDGSGKAIGVSTVPPDLPVTVTYDGSTGLPVHVGAYAVTAVVDTVNYQGEEAATLTIEKGAQVITFNQSGLIDARSGIDLQATASSGLPVTYALQDMVPSNELNRVSLYNGYQMRFQMEAPWAELDVVAGQAGDDNWYAQAVTNAFQVTAIENFSSWAEDIADPEQRGLTDCPAGDGIPNLLKYALGLNPEQVYTSEDVYTYELSTNALGILCPIMSYQLSTKTENISAGPEKTLSIRDQPWNTNGIVNTNIAVIEAYEFWQSFLSTASTNTAYMRLKVELNE